MRSPQPFGIGWFAFLALVLVVGVAGLVAVDTWFGGFDTVSWPSVVGFVVAATAFGVGIGLHQRREPRRSPPQP